MIFTKYIHRIFALKKYLIILLSTLTIFTTFLSEHSFAGLMEVSATYSTRSSRLDDDNYSESESLTGSFSWYFLDLSALELSYTKGLGTLSTKASGDPDAIKYLTEMNMIGADLVFTFAGRESVIQPFVKAGAASVKKKIFRELANGQTDTISETDGYKTVPSWGVGLKVNLTKSLAIKGSYDRWKSASDDDSDLWDEAIRGGISLYF
jgi:hypothetical protein